MAVRCKTFDAYIRELIAHPERSKKWMNDRRLTSAEKRILKGHLFVRNNKYQEAIEELKLITTTDFDFVMAHKNLLFGICYNNIGKYDDGLKYINLAITEFENKNQNYHLFTAYYNLINNLGNLGLIKEMSPVIDKMKALRVTGKLQEIRLLRCEFMFASDSNNFPAAEILLTKIHKLKSSIPDSELGPQLIFEFIFYIKTEQMERAEDIIVQMKKHRNFMVSENFHFMKKLLSHLLHNDTLYVYERNFTSSDSALFRQIKIIEELQSQNKDKALEHWRFLQEKFGKEVYADNFQWAGEKCLFSLCLKKNLDKVTNEKPTLKIISSETPKYQILYEALKNAKSPIRAGELYEIIYGECAEDKDDLKKLVLLVINIRKQYGAEIISRKGTYELVNKETLLKAAKLN